MTDFAKIDTIFTTSEIFYLTDDIIESEVDILYKIILGVDFMKKLLSLLLVLSLILGVCMVSVFAADVKKTPVAEEETDVTLLKESETLAAVRAQLKQFFDEKKAAGEHAFRGAYVCEMNLICKK